MANNGSFNTNTYRQRYLQFSWKLESQSITDNSSTISWQVKGAGGPATWINAGNFKVIIDNTVVYQHYDIIQLTHQVVASGTKKIYHGNDGTKTFTASASCGIYYYESSNSSGSGRWNLPSIPRAAGFVSAPDFNDEENPTIKFSNPLGNNVSALNTGIYTTGGSLITAYRKIDPTSKSYTFEFSESERETLREYCNNANSKKIRFMLITTMGGKTYYSGRNQTLTIVNAYPTIAPEVFDDNPASVKVTGNNKDFIKYESNARWAINGKTLKGATIASQSITNGSQTINDANGVIQKVESGEFVFKLTDSRGNTITQTINRTCYPYLIPSISISSSHMDSFGNLTFNCTGNVFSGKLGTDTANFIKVYYKCYTGETPSDWTEIDAKEITYNTESEYEVTHVIEGLTYSKTYILQLKIVDFFNVAESNAIKVVSKPVFDWDDKDFNFNIPVTFSAGIKGGTGDIVVEQGKDGIWTYRKWSSGVAECWGRYKQSEINLNLNATNGIVYSPNTVKANLPVGLFIKEPSCMTSFQGVEKAGTTYASWDYIKARATETTTSSHSFYRIGSPQTGLTAVYDFHVVGRWK